MRVFLKTLHLISLSIFLGSIISYIMICEITYDDISLSFSRYFIMMGTQFLTIPAMWAVGITGIIISGIPKNLWMKIKAIGFMLVMLNTHLFIFPAIRDAVISLKDNNHVMFKSATSIEAIAGFVNIVLIITLIVVAVKKRQFLSRSREHQ